MLPRCLGRDSLNTPDLYLPGSEPFAQSTHNRRCGGLGPAVIGDNQNFDVIDTVLHELELGHTFGRSHDIDDRRRMHDGSVAADDIVCLATNLRCGNSSQSPRVCIQAIGALWPRSLTQTLLPSLPDVPLACKRKPRHNAGAPGISTHRALSSSSFRLTLQSQPDQTAAEALEEQALLSKGTSSLCLAFPPN